MSIFSQDQSLLKNFRNLTGEVYGYLRIRFFVILITQFFIGLLENLGILTLLPIIYVALDLGGKENNSLYQYLEMFLQALHIPMELEYLLFIFAAVIFLKSALNFLASYLVQVEILKIVADLRRQLIAAFFQARWSFFTRIEPGKYGSILTGELVKTSSAVTAVFLLLNGIVVSVIYLASAFFVSFKLTLLVCTVSILSMAFLNPLVKQARQAGYKNSKVLNSITTFMINTLQGMKSIKAMNIEDRSRKILLADNEAILDSSRQAYFYTILFKNVRDPIVSVALIATIFLSLYVLDLPLPNLAVLLLIFNRSLVKMMDMQSVVQSFAVNEAGYLNVRHAIEEIKDSAEESETGQQTTKKELQFEQGINVQNLATLIDGTPILEHVNFMLPAKGLHVFTGPSGGGKTSMIDTLITLRDEYEGSIFYDDADLRRIDPAVIRQNVGYVMQEIQLFHTTIRENILIARPEATDKQIIDILKNINAAEFVDALEGGLDTVVGEAGSKLSGGQRQRIALARALIRQPKILILDEITSALDQQNTRTIMGTIKDIAAHTCIILISHDQSAIQWADQVFEVKDKTVKKIK